MAVGTTVQVTLPQMGESVSEGTVLEWHAAEGDQVSADQTLVEVSTDKVDAEVPAPASGTLVKIVAQEGDTVAVGAVLAEIDTNGAGAPPEAEAPPAEDAKELEVVMPQMGESVSEGTVLEWHKQPGDAVAADETIVEISTDKVDAEVPAPASGTMGDILAQAGETVTVGQILGRMTSGNGASAPAPAAKAPQPTSAPRPAGEVPAPLPEGTKATPVARRVAAAHGVDLGAVQGSGPAGRIGKDDVLAATKNGATASTNG